jgi:hypothetical protein
MKSAVTLSGVAAARSFSRQVFSDPGVARYGKVTAAAIEAPPKAGDQNNVRIPANHK